MRGTITTSIAPWLTVADGHRAVEFYKAAFDADEKYRMEDDHGIVVKLSVDGAEFWISSEVRQDSLKSYPALGGETIKIVLTVNDPHKIFSKALAAGATEIFPIGEGHGWLLGRLVDPFGLHWEIGHPLE